LARVCTSAGPPPPPIPTAPASLTPTAFVSASTPVVASQGQGGREGRSAEGLSIFFTNRFLMLPAPCALPFPGKVERALEVWHGGITLWVCVPATMASDDSETVSWSCASGCEGSPYRVTVVDAEGPHRPTLAVLMGWFQPSETPSYRALNSYARVHRLRGRSTVEIVMPQSSLLGRGGPRKQREAAVALAKLVTEDPRMSSRFGPRSVFLHPFSNGGMFLARWFAEGALSGSEDDVEPLSRFREKIGGLICDSCPAYIFPGLPARVVATGLGMPWLESVLYPWYVVQEAVGRWVLGGGGDRRSEFWTAMVGARWGKTVGELYVYSNADPLCDAAKLADLVRRRKDGGDAVRGPNAGPLKELRLDDSAHVAHLVKYPDAYVGAIDAFVTECLLGTPPSKL